MLSLIISAGPGQNLRTNRNRFRDHFCFRVFLLPSQLNYKQTNALANFYCFFVFFSRFLWASSLRRRCSTVSLARASAIAILFLARRRALCSSVSLALWKAIAAFFALFILITTSLSGRRSLFWAFCGAPPVPLAAVESKMPGCSCGLLSDTTPDNKTNLI